MEKRKKNRTKEELRNKYIIKIKGFKVIIGEQKQRFSAKSEKLRRYRARVNQYNTVKTNFSDATKSIVSRVRWKERSTQIPDNGEETK